MAGYSGKPLVQKLGIKPGFCIFTAGLPSAYSDIVGNLPAQVTVASRLTGKVDMIHVFATRAAALADKLPIYRDANPAGRDGLGIVAQEIFQCCDRFVGYRHSRNCTAARVG
jgi:hypothetical protein